MSIWALSTCILGKRTNLLVEAEDAKAACEIGKKHWPKALEIYYHEVKNG